jgi:intracellular sulfur oxidation DsrE/DsrF family protein
MLKKIIAPLMMALALGLFVTPAIADQDEGVHKVVLHVDDNDPTRMNMALNNAANIDAYYKEKGEEVMIEVVTYGPGLHMLRKDTSPVKKRIASFGENFNNISFKACGNTLRKMSQKGPVELIPQAEPIPSGVIWLMERQEQGWTYLRP